MRGVSKGRVAFIGNGFLMDKSVNRVRHVGSVGPEREHGVGCCWVRGPPTVRTRRLRGRLGIGLFRFLFQLADSHYWAKAFGPLVGPTQSTQSEEFDVTPHSTNHRWVIHPKHEIIIIIK